MLTIFNIKTTKNAEQHLKERQAVLQQDDGFTTAPLATTPLNVSGFSTDGLQDAQEKYQRDRDLMYLLHGLYA